MTERVLFVDDDPNILAGFRRQLRGQYDVETAQGGQLGLEAMIDKGPFAVVVADMRMPGMDGIQFLAQAREIAPQTVRMMLTGHSDFQTAMEAVNEGNIFRFLTKPCPPALLSKSVAAATEQYRLIMAEKELLEKTLSGSLKVLSDVLALTRTKAFGHAQRARRLVKQLVRRLKIDSAQAKEWEIDVAAMLSQIGCVTVPDEVLVKVYGGNPLSEDEMQVFQSHPSIGAELIANIPRLSTVARIIEFQQKGFDGSGAPKGDTSGHDIHLGARILKVALDFDRHRSSGCSDVEALQRVQRTRAQYDPDVIKALEAVVAEELIYEVRTLNVNDLTGGMILADDVKTADGAMLVPKGHEVTETLRWRLKNFAKIGTISGKVSALVRVRTAQEEIQAPDATG